MAGVCREILRWVGGHDAFYSDHRRSYRGRAVALGCRGNPDGRDNQENPQGPRNCRRGPLAHVRLRHFAEPQATVMPYKRAGKGEK